MTVTLSGKALVGETAIIASKSVVHRLLICAALCDTPTVLTGVTYSEDIEATIACLRALAADIRCEDDRVTVMPRTEKRARAVLDCGESGSTLRFLLPIAAALGGAQFTGRGRLSQRPLTPVYAVLQQHGCELSAEGNFPLTVSGVLQGDTFAIDGSLSSQFISGLLMAVPLFNKTCRVRVIGIMTSYPYIALTMEALAKFGVAVERDGNVFTVSGRYVSPERLPAEGDWSNAGFWLPGAAISHSDEFALDGLAAESVQGDRRITALLREAGFTVVLQDGRWRVSGEGTRALRVDAEDIPDLVPIVAVLATALSGETAIYHAQRLIHKESNRLESVRAMLTALGGSVRLTNDGLVITGTPLGGGTVDSYNDHRIVMAAAIAALRCREPVTIVGAEAVRKSYPTFFEELEKRGMQVCRAVGDET